jgi:hypothetical protein
MEGKPVKIVHRNHVGVVFPPGEGQYEAAKKAYSSNAIHTIEHTGNSQDQYRLLPPHNKSGKELTPEGKELSEAITENQLELSRNHLSRNHNLKKQQGQSKDKHLP